MGSPTRDGVIQHQPYASNHILPAEATQHYAKSVSSINPVEESVETTKVKDLKSSDTQPIPSASNIECKQEAKHVTRSPPISIPPSNTVQNYEVPTLSQSEARTTAIINPRTTKLRSHHLTVNIPSSTVIATSELCSPTDDDGRAHKSLSTSPEGEGDLQFECDADEQVFSASSSPTSDPGDVYSTAPLASNESAQSAAGDAEQSTTPTPEDQPNQLATGDVPLLAESPSTDEDFDDSEFSEDSLTIDEEAMCPRTIHQFSSDDEQDQSVDADNDPSMLPTTIADEDIPEEASGERDHNRFWHYNKLTKGPKPHVTFDVDVTHAEKNPHNPIVFNDPVYDKSQPLLVQHPGRARVGEGNDITPNPGKLVKLGNDLKEVQKKMADLGDGRKHKREKMRCSSRMCRLKRSANHEANKIKMAGLEQEREELSSVIAKVRNKMANANVSESGCLTYLQQLKADRLQTTVAGQTGDYVNSVLESITKPPIYCDSDSD